MKKYQVIFLIIIQGLIAFVILGTINSKKIFLGINKQNIISSIVVNLIIIGIYMYIIKKFWVIRKRVVYKIFLILNSLYLVNILINSYRMIFTPKIININLIVNTIFFIMLLGNIILILTYNRNLRKFVNKE